MGDYKETVERTLNDLRRAEKYCLNDYSRMAGNAANLIENILTENAALRRTIDNLTSAQAVVLKEFEAKLEELAEVKAKRSWISVKDRLPDEKQRVLVRCKTVGTTVGWRLWGEWMTDLGDGGSKVTHWMPLPEPPEKEA